MNKPTLKSLTDMGNDENNLSDIHEKALQLMEQGADISDEQLDELRADERLCEACLDLQAATMAFREDHDDTDVDDELSRLHGRLESRAAERPLRRWWAAAAVALFLVAGGAWWVSAHRAPADNTDASAYVTVLQGDDETRQVTLQTDERTTVLPSREHRQGGTATAAGTLEAARLQAETVKLTVPLGKTYRVASPKTPAIPSSSPRPVSPPPSSAPSSMSAATTMPQPPSPLSAAASPYGPPPTATVPRRLPTAPRRSPSSQASRCPWLIASCPSPMSTPTPTPTVCRDSSISTSPPSPTS